MDRLSGKVAIVTGGAQGIGRGIVDVFVEEGARVAVLDWDAEAGRRMAAELPVDGGRVLGPREAV